MPPLALASTEDAEVEVAQRLLDEALLVVLGERLARDLLGREHRQVGNLATDLVDRAAGLRLDVTTGLLEQPLALGAGGLDGFLLMRLAGLAGAGDDLIGLRAGLGQALAVLVEHLLGVRAQLLGGVDRVRDRLGARGPAPAPITGNTYLRSMKKTIPNTTSTQIISPTLGVIRNEPDDAIGMCAAADISDLEQEGCDEPADEAVEEAGLGQGEAEPLVALDVLAQLRLTGLGRDRRAEHGTDARTRAGRATAGANAEGDRLAGLLADRR